MVRKLDANAFTAGSITEDVLAATINDKANNAYAVANSASTQANTARNTANSAYAQANTGGGIAKSFLTGTL